jgi:hypothetical protein
MNPTTAQFVQLFDFTRSQKIVALDVMNRAGKWFSGAHREAMQARFTIRHREED